MDLTIFIPCRNEENNIISTLDNIKYSVTNIKYEIIIVDDGSTDKTIDMIEKYKILNKKMNIIVIQRTNSLGIGKNYFLISKIAVGKHFMLINGDGVEPRETIKILVNSIGKADIIIPFFGDKDMRTNFRKNLSKIFTFIVNRISGNSIKYYNGTVIHKTDLIKYTRLETFGYGYQAEIICELLLEKKSYYHVEVANSDRQWGTSKAFAISNFLSVANSLAHILIRRIQQNLI